jgi:hypothetical protein
MMGQVLHQAQEIATRFAKSSFCISFRLWRASCLVTLATMPSIAGAVTALSDLRWVADTAVLAEGTLVQPNDVATDTLAGFTNRVLSALPAKVNAYYFAGHAHWLVFETSVALPGGITATPRDVVAWNGASYSFVFRGAAAGIPDGVMIDALSSTDGSDILLSLDTTITLGRATIGPEDVLRHANGVFGFSFNGSGAGVPAGANTDAIAFLPNGHWLLSFDTAGTVGGVSFHAGDVLEYSPGGNAWELAFSPRAQHAGWGAANLRGLWAKPVPSGAPGRPTLVRLIPGTSSVRASFIQPLSSGSSAIFAYTLSCVPDGGGLPLTTTGVSSPLSLAGLAKHTSYRCFVHASNTYGDGAESTPEKMKTGSTNLVPLISILLGD